LLKSCATGWVWKLSQGNLNVLSIGEKAKSSALQGMYQNRNEGCIFIATLSRGVFLEIIKMQTASLKFNFGYLHNLNSFKGTWKRERG